MKPFSLLSFVFKYLLCFIVLLLKAKLDWLRRSLVEKGMKERLNDR